MCANVRVRVRACVYYKTFFFLYLYTRLGAFCVVFQVSFWSQFSTSDHKYNTTNNNTLFIWLKNMCVQYVYVLHYPCSVVNMQEKRRSHTKLTKHNLNYASGSPMNDFQSNVSKAQLHFPCRVTACSHSIETIAS